MSSPISTHPGRPTPPRAQASSGQAASPSTARRTVCVDGNEAAASVAYRCNEVVAIYPITPASPMGELCDVWATEKRPNLWGCVPDVAEMQSEGGAAGAVHGALQGGALTTTFTASQGLLLMLPNLYKIAGELTSFCLHVAARTVATHALSIFGDHSDVMAARQTGFALLCSGSVQEAHDLAAIAQAATLEARIPFLHFFDGFRTSHEIARIEELSDDDLRALLDEGCVAAHRARGLTPDKPVLRGTAQNPDVFFQAREASEPFHRACPGVVQRVMERFAALTGRRYGLVDYVGHPQAEEVLVLMGSGAETAQDTVEHMVAAGRKVGLLKVRLYRPFPAAALRAALPASARRVAVLDRTKEPGAPGDPLYLDVLAALREDGDAQDEAGTTRATAAADGGRPEVRVLGGRYGLSSKEFTPPMVAAVFNELRADQPRRHFTVGIQDDVCGTSLEIDKDFDVEQADVVRAVFYGLGSDGTVGANKNSIKIIGERKDLHVQGYFVYDSKKSGAVTVSHLRFGPRPIRAPYLIRRAGFVAVHQWTFLDRYDVLESAAHGATLLLNAPFPAEEVWGHLPREVQEAILEKELAVWAIDAYAVARDAGLGGRINTIMQACFFAIAGVLPRDEALAAIKGAVEKTYGKRGRETVQRNHEAIDHALAHLHRITLPARADSPRHRPPLVPDHAPDFVRKVTAVMMAGKGDLLPVSAFPPDGTWPTGTARWEKRNIAKEIPIWDPAVCVQCNLCALVCPHAAIRSKVYDPAALEGAPAGFRSNACRVPGLDGLSYTIQVAPEDCTGCSLCVAVCPAKDRTNPRHKAIDMAPHDEHLAAEREGFAFFLELPELDASAVPRLDARGSQLLPPLFEASGACAGCGETPYLKLLTQLFGSRALVANATGCSSIFGGNLPTTPWGAGRDGRGPAWSNSLFEDNAEFGYGFRLAVDSRVRTALRLLERLSPLLGDGLAAALVRDAAAPAGPESGDLAPRRARLEDLKRRLEGLEDPDARHLLEVADALVPRSVWLVGGDGWAYDIGYGGLDHVLAAGRDVNVLVLDTEVYSNTGGQQSKATPLGAAAKFATAGKEVPKKDLGLEAMSYGHVYVAQVALGASPNQTVKAFLEAESYRGPSLIIAYSPCIAHGYDLRHSADQSKLATRSGVWPLYRYDPRRSQQGEPPLQLDSGPPSVPVRQYMRNEARFRMLERIDRERFRRLQAAAQRSAAQRWGVYQQLAGVTVPQPPEEELPDDGPATAPPSDDE